MKFNYAVSFKTNLKKRKPKFAIRDSIRTSISSHTVSEEDNTNWKYGLYTLSKAVDGKIPNYYSEYFPEKNRGALLK